MSGRKNIVGQERKLFGHKLLPEDTHQIPVISCPAAMHVLSVCLSISLVPTDIHRSVLIQDTQI